MAKFCRKTPPVVERQLRQEARYGCAFCGTPILENAHIIPYNISHSFIPEDMIALCPTHHRKADTGHYPESVLRDAKQNPHNITKTEDEFKVTGKDLIVNLGSFRAINTTRVLVVDDFDIVTIRRDHGNYLFLDVNFFDRLGRFVGIVLDSKWFVDTSFFWDVEYISQHLTIRSKPRKIELDIKIEREEVCIIGELYYNGSSVSIERNAINCGGNILTGLTIEGGHVGVHLHTH